ncbi:MAG: helix-turn-helix domain-containing protein [Saprospiraceae bacterium]
MIILQLNENQLKNALEEVLRKVLAERQPGLEQTTVPIQAKELLTIEEASIFLNLAKPTIYSLTSRRELPFFKTGKKLYFKRSELLSWIEKGKQKTIEETVDNLRLNRKRIGK